jgi:hypothetical protein
MTFYRQTPCPVRAEGMAAACRKLAADLRREHAMEWPPIRMAGLGWGAPEISRAAAAISMDQQAERWESEMKTGVRNTTDRARIGA